MNVMQGGDKAQAPTGDYPRVRIIRPGEKAHSGSVIFFPTDSAELSDIARQELDIAAESFTRLHPQYKLLGSIPGPREAESLEQPS